MEAVEVLGSWKRGRLREQKWIRSHFRQWLWERGYAVQSDNSIEVRGPSSDILDTLEWHQDGNYVDISRYKKRRFLIVVWADKRPTEIRLKKSKRVLTTKVGDVILFRNDLVEHRTPEGGMAGRWFIRATDVRKIFPSRI